MRKHFFSGIQPSGRLHIGNYFGAIKQWVALQDSYEPVFGIVDFHGMTARYDPKDMPVRVLDAAASYLAAGLDPERSIIMLQSLVLEHLELA
ncbi:MAG: tryptophan--tRNA ligase, partial [Candidatus Eisenbacteria sp.]|nr:tryptophan--tRNA ligase [Candidatus Eisenbacteria bacterium]